MKAKIGILGSGDVGRALAKAFSAEGHEVMLGSRDPGSKKLADWSAQLASPIATGFFSETAAFAEIAVIAVRGTAVESALALALPERFQGKIAIDATNPLKMSPDKILTLAAGHTDSLGEAVQRMLPGARVVKAFNTVNNAHMHRPQFPGGIPEMLICGNDAGAKQTVSQLLASFGWNAVDVGGIEASRLLEPLALLGIRYALKSGNWNYVFRLITR